MCVCARARARVCVCVRIPNYSWYNKACPVYSHFPVYFAGSILFSAPHLSFLSWQMRPSPTSILTALVLVALANLIVLPIMSSRLVWGSPFWNLSSSSPFAYLLAMSINRRMDVILVSPSLSWRCLYLTPRWKARMALSFVIPSTALLSWVHLYIIPSVLLIRLQQ